MVIDFEVNCLIFVIDLLNSIKERKHMMEEMGAAYMAEGIVTLAGSRMYTSLADDESIIDDALTRFERVFRNIELPAI